jgi:hypothetical protein
MSQPDPRADALLVELRRAGPDGMEKGELAIAVGLEPDDFRAGMAQLEELSAVRIDGERYIAIDTVEASDLVGTAVPSGGADDQDAEHEPPPDSPPPIPAAPAKGPTYRAIFSVAVTFGATRGENRDEQAMKRASQIGSNLAEHSGGSVELEGLEAYDSARVVFPPPDGEDQADQ